MVVKVMMRVVLKVVMRVMMREVIWMCNLNNSLISSKMKGD